VQAGSAFLAPDAVGEKREPPRRRDAHVELPQRAGRRVARIHELALAFLPLCAFIARKSRLSMSTSPRTSISAGGCCARA
jgi:hypothetical protein